MRRAIKPPKRFGAFLRLYGPLDARTHAKLVLAHAPRPHTPEAFHDELEEERKWDWHARRAGVAAVMRVQLEPSR